METINSVFLSGNLTGDASFESIDGKDWITMEVKTFRSSWNGNEKIKTPEFHEVRSLNLQTIAKYLKKGKAVVVQGRSIPSTDDADDFILATSITFPCSSREE